MKLYLKISASAVLVIVGVYVINAACDLLNLPSDAAVVGSVVIILTLAFVEYKLFGFIWRKK